MEQIRNAGRTKPVGGYVLIEVEQLCAVWTAYAQKRIRLLDLRAWFACRELAARRCRLARSRCPKFTTEELHGLLGGTGGRHLRAAVRRLETLGLLHWRENTLEFPPTCASELLAARD